MYLLLVVLVLKALFGVLVVLFGQIHLNPDEAQYWLWSQNLDFGYYSKPPAIAWEIAFGTSLFGNTEIGVRFGAILLSIALSLATYALARAALLKEKEALWAALIIAFCPLGLIGSFAATTDLGFVTFWTLALALLIKKEPSWLLLGLMILCGILFKWTLFLIFPIMFFIYRDKRAIYAALIGLLGLLPSLYWNINHDFATFKHVTVQSVSKSVGNPIEFFLAQVGLFFPIFFAALFVAIARLKKMGNGLKIITVLTFLIFLAYEWLSFRQKVQANWAVFAFPLAAVVAASQITKFWFKVGLIASILLSCFALAVPLLQTNNIFDLPYSFNLFKPSLGWDQLKKALDRKGYKPNSDVLIADRYQTACVLSFYTTGQKRAYLLNLIGQRKNQFFFWPGLKQHQDGFFVVIESKSESNEDYEELLKPYFSRVEKLDPYPLFFANGIAVKWALIYKVEDYTGLLPKDTDLY